MTIRTRTLAGLLAPLLLLGCGADKNPQGVIPKGYEDAVEKAKSVEDTLQNAAQQQLQQLDQRGGRAPAGE